MTGTEVTSSARTETAVYGTVRTVVWEDGGGDPASYPLGLLNITILETCAGFFFSAVIPITLIAYFVL